MYTVLLTKFLLKKRRLQQIQIKIADKETLLVNDDEIAKAFNKDFTEMVEKLNTFEWP